MKNTRVLNRKGAMLDKQQLENYLEKVAADQVLKDTSDRDTYPIPSMEENFAFITKVYQMLNEDLKLGISIHPAGEWILDNYYILEETVKSIQKELTLKKYTNFLGIQGGMYHGFARIYVLASEMIAYTDNRMDGNLLESLLKAYQRKKTLSMEEIWNIGIFIQIVLIQNIRDICEKIYSSGMQKQRVENIIERIIDNKPKEKQKYKMPMTYKAKLFGYGEMKYPFIEYMSHQLKRRGRKASGYLAALEEQVIKMGTTIDEVIKKEHFDIAVKKVSMANAITSMKVIKRINFLEIFEQINGVEELLNEDPAGIYCRMDYESKADYRNAIKQIAKKTKVSELYIAEKLLELAGEQKEYFEQVKQGEKPLGEGEYLEVLEKKTHIGYYLIADGYVSLMNTLQTKKVYKPRREQKIKRYVIGVFLGSFLLSLFTIYSLYEMSHQIFFSVLGGILLFLPLSEILIQTVQYILGKIVKPKRIPKLDMQNKIPEDSRTFVVIPTIIKSKDKVDDLYHQLEVFYLANQSPNLYFALLGDASSSKQEEEPFDEEVIKAGIKACKKLNTKYPVSGFPIFHFIYRKRIWNTSESSFLGWERKRGLLNQFNEYILGKQKNPFRTNTIEEYTQKKEQIVDNDSLKTEKQETKIPEIKYIITLDADTKLVLNTAFQLVGAMRHILNTPVINKQKNIVIDGYGIMQPRVGIDLISSQKTKFTKIFAGSGGTDPYTNAISDTYQDNFGEGIFTGKGIYNVGVFSEVLGEAIPENTVLSHDLLEGNYIRCGLVSDILLMDGYPTKYNSFMTRLHRWIRGDWQIITWLKKRVKNKKGEKIENPLPLLAKYKIADNLRRSLIEPACFLALCYFAIWKMARNIPVWGVLLLLIITVIYPSILDVINYIIFRKEGNKKQKTFTKQLSGLQASMIRGILSLSFLPHKAYSALTAVIKTGYRMLITKRRLLEWTTAEEAEKQAKNDVITYYKTMLINVLAGILLLVILSFYPFHIVSILLYALAISWLVAPYVAWYISKEEKKKKPIELLNKEEQEYMREIAKETWQFFKEYMNKANHYLPPDNYQEDRKPLAVNRTSSTNIGLGLLAICSGYDFGFDTLENVLDILENMLNTITSLPKWNGHLYNWYQIDTLVPLIPRYVSTVDSGNFIGYVYTLKSFLQEAKEKIQAEMKSIEEQKEIENEEEKIEKEKKQNRIQKIESMIKITEKLIQDTDFSILYDSEAQLFSIGYNVEENKLTDSYYDLLASEARQASLIAISKKDVPEKHWNSLSRTMTVLNQYKGLISWSGTAFEYLMPTINIKKYPGSILDESCKFMIESQKEYTKKLGIPWGISEAAFYLKDLNGNYQYKAFGIPWLGLKRGLADEMVVAPYGSILAINDAPKDVVKNLKELEKQEMKGKYGFYESIDYTPSRLRYGKQYVPVKTYMAHHQGLILLAINNLFHQNILQERFSKNPEIEAVDILLQEKMPEKMMVTKEQKEKVEKLRYTDYESYTEKVFTKMLEKLPNTNVIANEGYTVVVDETGKGYSQYEDILINRYKRTSDIDQGIFFYLKDIKTNRIWTSYMANYSEKPEKYTVIFAPDKDEFSRVDGNIETKMKITTGEEKGIEIRRLEVTNYGNSEETLEITAFMEPILSPKENDYSHMAFNNLFLTYAYEEETESILVKRKERQPDKQGYMLATMLYTEQETVGEIEYEIDKEKLKGRENNRIPQKIRESKPFSKKIGLVTDPIIAMRRAIKIKPGKTATLDFVLVVGKEKEEIQEKIKQYQNSEKIKRSFELARARVEAENQYLGLKGKEVEDYQKLLSYLLLQNPLKARYLSKLPQKTYLQSELWKFGISGDIPILVARIQDVNDIYVIEDLLKAYEWIRLKNIKMDFVILDEEKYSYDSYVREAIENAILNSHQAYLKNIPGGIFVLSESEMTKEDIDLFLFRANVLVDCKAGLAVSHLKELEEEFLEKQKNIGKDLVKNKLLIEEKMEISHPVKEREKLKYYNEYGGFSEKGDTYYLVTNREEKLPTVWSHILANEDFGTVITENMGGYTWNQNSRLNRITAWSNNQVEDVPSEVIYIKDKEIGKKWSLGANPMPDENDYYVTYGFGYGKYTHASSGMIQEDAIFVPRKDQVKIQILKLQNTNPFKKKYRLLYYIKPVLGEDEIKTDGYLRVQKEESNNLIYIQNEYQTEEKEQITYLSCSEEITSFTGSKTSFMGKGSLANPESLDKTSLDNQSGLRRILMRCD